MTERTALGQWAKNGTPEERFDRLVCPEPNSGCWLWMGTADKRGYGRFRVTRTPNVRMLAHRFAYERHYHVKLTRDQLVCHKCDNPSCVNPDHFFLGTHSTNKWDMAIKCRGRKSKVGLPYGARPHRKRFRSMLTFKYRTIHLPGTFATPEEASAVALAMKEKLINEEVSCRA
jgi:hypothetical protein